MPSTDLITLARGSLRRSSSATNPPPRPPLLRFACRGQQRPWEGKADRKPVGASSHGRHSASGNSGNLARPAELLALQTVRPYVLLLDTGSSPAVVRTLETLRRPDVEVHTIRAHAYAHSSAPVTTAMDLAFALCRTPVLALHAIRMCSPAAAIWSNGCSAYATPASPSSAMR